MPSSLPQEAPEPPRACGSLLGNTSITYQGLGNGPAWAGVLSSPSFSQGWGSHCASCTKGLCPQQLCLGWGLAQLAVLPTSSLTPHEPPLNQHFHTPTKQPRNATAGNRGSSRCPQQQRSQTAERRGWEATSSSPGHPCRAGSPSWHWMSTARLKAATDGQPRCAPQMKMKSINPEPFQQGM